MAAEVGDKTMRFKNGGGGLTVTDAFAYTLVLAKLVTRTVTSLVAVTEGAVKSPVLVMVPALDDHFTEVLVVPPTVAVNCCVPLETKVTVVGEIPIVTVLLARAKTDPRNRKTKAARFIVPFSS